MNVPLGNTLCNKKTPVDNALSLQARRYQQADYTRSGKQSTPSYSVNPHASNLFLVAGFLIDSGRMLVSVIHGGAL